MKEEVITEDITLERRDLRTKRSGSGAYNPTRGGDKRIDRQMTGCVNEMRTGGSEQTKKLRKMRPDEKNPKLIHYTKLRLLTEKTDEKGDRVPFRVRYAAKNGDIVDDVCVCTKVEPNRKRRTVYFVGGKLPRSLRDVLILEVNDYKVVVN